MPWEHNGDACRYSYNSYGDLTLLRYTEADGTVNYYYAVCNSRGDVEGIYNGAGELRAHYTYDSWGNVISITDQNGKEITSSTHIGILNPIRYRGYYYDAETGMYYVGSRYYDPQVGRWINADDTAYLGAGETLVSYNLFAYCSNNPVTGYDLDGTWDWGNFSKGSGWVATGVVAVAVGVSVLTCGVAAPAMMAVAAVTVTAGVATAVNGVSEIGEAATGHNFMRDDVFRGNSTAYNAYAYSTAITAQI